MSRTKIRTRYRKRLDAADRAFGRCRHRPAGVARAQAPAEVKVGLIVPLSGIYARPGQVMKMGAEMASSTSMRRAASRRSAAPS